MDFEWSWLLLGLPLAFMLGWLASRLDWRQMRVLQRSSPRTYFQGLTYLLNEQQDKAIDVFVEAVQSDPETIELHFALGSLFRRRGEYHRAVRVHEHLLARADLSAADRARAQWGLAQDYLKIGLFDFAEQALQPLIGTELEPQAQTALLYVYERLRDWPQALALLERIDAQADAAPGADATDRQPRMLGRQVHYWCEQAQQAARARDYPQAQALLQQAQAQASALAAADGAQQHVRPAMEHIQLLQQQGQHLQALQAGLELARQQPEAMPLVASCVRELLPRVDAQQPALQQLHALLRAHYQREPSLDVLLALVAIEQRLGWPQAAQWYVEHVRRRPSLVAAARWMQAQLDGPQAVAGQLDMAAQEGVDSAAAVQASLDKALQPRLHYRCTQCGFETQHYFWQCPGCQSWESFPPRRVEEL
ncbi:lipopolysaccharide assembly protein LapB [Vandammella animalimorsus]|uniref:Lipopolysaccharide assembly protein B n=1 Tax=Vandammella animalimorsus TaxID=2029117 RepID=A0A2A2AUG9_9BURK|nr:tetratricopeptide repeat protein [Vandammella animalimorsus]PAT41378.1 lipopolysaccharide assembly protein LapB [Vandammella animalimorsus]